MNAANGRKSIFITGAASGMGRATAELFAERGWFVGAYDLSRPGLDTLRDEIGAENGVFGTLDVTDAAAFGAAVDGFGAATGGKLDLLFLNAGIATGGGLFDELPWDEIMKVISVNLFGVMHGARAGVRLLKQTSGSLCLVNASSSAIFGTAGIATYSLTKHAVRGLVEALSIEFKRLGVRAADLLPGLIDTPLLSDEMRAMAPTEGEWRLVRPREIAETVMAAYGSDKLHWYVPEELRRFHAEVVADPEAVRENRVYLFPPAAAAVAAKS